ncbi:MAG: hypothetical protein EHM48_07655 [Planctomycetaceae bacterium]|nr:MAG: hypothetical protein EHM48_07655 [Planctomycetaceae bacterium]
MPRNDPLKSVLRTLDVLELVGMSRNGLQLKDLEKSFGGALHTLLRTLVQRGYLIKLEHPIRYELGPAVQNIDQRTRHDALAQQVGPIMIEICRQSGMNVMYQQPIGNHVVVRLKTTPEKHLFVKRCSWISSPYGTAVVFQAYMTPHEQDAYWATHEMHSTYQELWGNLENLRKYLKLVARQRLAIIDSRADGKFRVSGPILNSAGQAIAAISAIQDCDKITPQQAQTGVQLIYRAALQLSSPQLAQNPAALPATPATAVSAVKHRTADSACTESRSNQQYHGENQQTTLPTA